MHSSQKYQTQQCASRLQVQCLLGGFWHGTAARAQQEGTHNFCYWDHGLLST
jgi:hypothetical protein